VKDEWHCWSWFPKEWCCGSYGPNGVCIHWWAVSSPFAGVGGFMAFNQCRGRGRQYCHPAWPSIHSTERSRFHTVTPQRRLQTDAAGRLHVSLRRSCDTYRSHPCPRRSSHQWPLTSPYCFLSTNDSRLPVVFANAEANESVKRRFACAGISLHAC
jgi:hypothetical protein